MLVARLSEPKGWAKRTTSLPRTPLNTSCRQTGSGLIWPDSDQNGGSPAYVSRLHKPFENTAQASARPSREDASLTRAGKGLEIRTKSTKIARKKEERRRSKSFSNLAFHVLRHNFVPCRAVTPKNHHKRGTERRPNAATSQKRQTAQRTPTETGPGQR